MNEDNNATLHLCNRIQNEQQNNNESCSFQFKVIKFPTSLNVFPGNTEQRLEYIYPYKMARQESIAV